MEIGKLKRTVVSCPKTVRGQRAEMRPEVRNTLDKGKLVDKVNFEVSGGSTAVSCPRTVEGQRAEMRQEVSGMIDKSKIRDGANLGASGGLVREKTPPEKEKWLGIVGSELERDLRREQENNKVRKQGGEELSGRLVGEKTPPEKEEWLGIVGSERGKEQEELCILRKERSPKIPIEVENLSTHALMDTGATKSLISKTLFSRLEKTFGVKSKIWFKTAGTEVMETNQIGPVRLKIANQTVEWDLHVGDIEHEMIIGADLMTHLEAVVDFGSQCVRIRQGESEAEVLFVVTDKGKSVRKEEVLLIKEEVSRPVKLISNIRLQGGSETVIPIQSKREEGDWLFEPEKNLSIMMSRSIGKGEQDVLVSFINYNAKTVILKRGTTIGHLLELKKVEKVKESIVELKGIKGKESPDKIKELLEGVGEDLSQEERDKLREILLTNSEVFAENDLDLGKFSAIEHSIDTGESRPIKLPMRRTPIHFQEEEDKQINKMLNAGVIRPSVSAWAAAPHLVKKADGSMRFVLDYRGINGVTKKDVFPLPHMEECIDALAGNIYFSKLDANSAYWQIPMKEEDKEKTAFRTRHGLFEFEKLPFGLTNSPSTYMRAMNLTLSGLNWNAALAFLDDIVILGSSVDDHLMNLSKVLGRFKEYGLRLKTRKCHLFQKEVEFLGRVIGKKGLTLTDRSVETIQNWKQPGNSKELQQFVGLVNFHRQFIKGYAELASPLYSILKTKKFIWTELQQKAFEDLKEALVSPAVLKIPLKVGTFTLDCDASDHSIGAELLQEQGGEMVVIGYGSFAFTPQQRKYCTTRKELLAIVRFTNMYRHYLLGQHFTVRTDHFCLQWLKKFKHIEGQLARWVEELEQFDMQIVHRKGRLHINADALSRIPTEEGCTNYRAHIDLENLPCGGCKYCRAFQEKWRSFEEEVDDVVYFGDRNKQELGEICSISFTKDLGWSQQEIAREQKEDKGLNLLVDVLVNGIEPEKGRVKLEGTEAKYYYYNQELFQEEGGIIIKKATVLYPKQLVVPAALRDTILANCHDRPTAAHQGPERTKHRIQLKYFWHRMARDIKRYVGSCENCNKNKAGEKKNKNKMILNHAGVTMEKVHADFIGPYPKTKSGNTCALVVVDQFSKWVEAIPLPNQEAVTTAQALVGQVFCRLGYPKQLVTDQGPNFDGELLKETCKLLHIDKLRTTPYRPQANGQAERLNRSIVSAIRSYINKAQDNWDESLPLIVSALRSSVNRHTGETPNLLMLGREINTPAEIMFPGCVEEASPQLAVRNLQSKLKLAHEEVREHLKEELKRTKQYYDLSAKPITFQVGDPVYYLNKAAPKKTNRKLLPVWTGPGIITKNYGQVNFVVKIKNREERVMNHDFLKKCNMRGLPRWIEREKTALKEGSIRKYCYCQKPDDGKVMLQCNECDLWVHAACIGLTSRKAAQNLDFKCKFCDKD